MVVFQRSLLLIAGTLNIIYGIAAILTMRISTPAPAPTTCSGTLHTWDWILAHRRVRRRARKAPTESRDRGSRCWRSDRGVPFWSRWASSRSACGWLTAISVRRRQAQEPELTAAGAWTGPGRVSSSHRAPCPTSPTPPRPPSEPPHPHLSPPGSQRSEDRAARSRSIATARSCGPSSCSRRWCWSFR